jgi:GR25 family glycosyltransferase involved in LPS biosynthesis
MKAYILYIEKGDSHKYALDALESCQKHGVRAELFKGVHDLLNVDITEKYGYTMGRPGTFDDDRQYHREFCCSLGHMMIWDRIIHDNEPAIVLEHDAVVKHSLAGLEKHMEDNTLVWLGPRVWSRDDYDYPKAVPMSFTTVDHFEGTHAYAITPKTAKWMLGHIYVHNHILMNVDGLMGVNNTFQLKMKAADPPLVVAEVGDRDTYAQAPEKGNATTNWENLPGFLKNLRPGAQPFPSTREALELAAKRQQLEQAGKFIYRT